MVRTTVIIETQTRDELKKLGQKGETYNQIINDLIRVKRNKEDSA
jgi:hypothetical protein